MPQFVYTMNGLGEFTAAIALSGRLTGTMKFGSISSQVAGTSNSTGLITIDPWTTNFLLGGTADSVWRASDSQFQLNVSTLTGGLHISVTTTASSGAWDADTTLVNVVRQ